MHKLSAPPIEIVAASLYLETLDCEAAYGEFVSVPHLRTSWCPSS